MKSAYQRIYNIMFQQLLQKIGESPINYIKIFQNATASVISVGNSYSEDKMMCTFLETFQQGVKYSSQISSHHAELIREENSLIKNNYLYLTYKLII